MTRNDLEALFVDGRSGNNLQNIWFILQPTKHLPGDSELQAEQMIWKRWKRGTTQFRELVKLGVPKWRATEGAGGTSP